ncbi:MAG: hypothetical protein KatS3mg111_3498 [Pirellulaceae bacterium]|nr:MAG: hypothetical protein KatS3mg111_3498 [Pirellulaceae bacterium]
MKRQSIPLGRWEEELHEYPHVLAYLEAVQRHMQLYWDTRNSGIDVLQSSCHLQEAAAGILAAWHAWGANQPPPRFLELGCGFGGVTGAAALFGMTAVGIEGNEQLAAEAEKLWQRHGITCQLWRGNFLPEGSHALLTDDDPRISAAADFPSAYQVAGQSMHHFDIVFAYPFPGEERFLVRVWEQFGNRSGVLLLYRGPYEVEMYRF